MKKMFVLQAPKNLLSKEVADDFFKKPAALVCSGQDVVIDLSNLKVANKKIFDQFESLKNSALKSNAEFNLYGMNSSMKELVEMIGKGHLLELHLDKLPSSDFNTSSKSPDVTQFDQSSLNPEQPNLTA